MKKRQHIKSFVTVFLLLALLPIRAQLGDDPTIFPSSGYEVCKNEVVTYSLSLANAPVQTWQVDGGVIQGSVNGQTVQVLWDKSATGQSNYYSGQISVTITGYDLVVQSVKIYDPESNF